MTYVNVNEKDADTNITIEFQDVESLGPQKGKISFHAGDENVVYDDAIIPYLQISYKSAHADNATRVREASSQDLPLHGTKCFLTLSLGKRVG